eukprot:s1071_g5.t1
MLRSKELERLLGTARVLALPKALEHKERQVRIAYILSTDMSKHMQDLADFRLKLGCKDFDPVGNAADHQLATMWLFRASDIAHSAKPWNIHRKWSMRVVQEFHEQGDRERAMDLPISPLCDREHFELAKSQTGFLQFVCIPMWQDRSGHGAQVMPRKSVSLQPPAGERRSRMGPAEPLHLMPELRESHTMSLGESPDPSFSVGVALRLLVECQENLAAWQNLPSPGLPNAVREADGNGEDDLTPEKTSQDLESVFDSFRGQAAHLGDSVAMMRRLGTAGYVAPEVLDTRSPGYGSLSDVFSAGCVLFFLYCGVEAYRDANYGATLQRTLAGKARFNHPKVKQVRSGTLHLLKKMLSPSPKKRPRAQKGCKALWNLGDEEVQESVAALEAVQNLPVSENETASYSRLQPVQEFREEFGEDDASEIGSPVSVYLTNPRDNSTTTYKSLPPGSPSCPSDMQIRIPTLPSSSRSGFFGRFKRRTR